MRKRNKQNKKFWNKEYDKKGDHNLAISTNPSSDLLNFLKWFDKYDTKYFAEVSLGQGSYVYDIGCGNGRNIMYLGREFGMVGSGFDISAEAITSAEEQSQKDGLDIAYAVHEMDGTIDLADDSVDLVLDMMASHFLNDAQRAVFDDELARVIKPGGWIFYKTFLLEGDRNAKKLLRDHPSPDGEQGTYIHPHMGVAEHVSTVDEIIERFSDRFKIHKMAKSHNHMKNGKAHKRRSVSVYLERLM